MTPPSGNRPARKPGAVMPTEMPGTARQLVLEWRRLPRTGPLTVWPGDSEIRLSASPERDVYLCTLTGAERYEVTGKTEADRRALREIRFGIEPYVAVTAHGTRLVRQENFSVRVHQYAHPVDLLPVLVAGLQLKVSDHIVAEARKLAGSREIPDTARALEWLSRQLLIGPAPGTPPGNRRMVVSAGRANSFASGFALSGPQLTANVALRADGADVTSLTSRGADRHDYQPFLAQGEIGFADDSSAYRDRDRIQTGLTLASRENGYLAMWEHYQEVEARFIRAQVHQFGSVRYTGCERRGSRFTFDLDLGRARPETRAALMAATTGSDRVEVEAASVVPESVANRDLTDADWMAGVAGKGEPSWVGEISDFSDENESLSAHATMSNQDPPPGQGWLYLAHRGDKSRLKRRDQALKDVRGGRVLLSALPTLLEGTPWMQPVGRRVKPMTAATRACFNAEPTKAQVDAIDAAINTPDIAVIQGPPGTGKTQVIAAIVARMSELADGADLAGTVLLTSFQHAAVDHLVTRARPLGLPPVKIDSRGRDSSAETDLWRVETARAVSAHVRKTEGGRHLQARREVTTLVTGYRIAPVLSENLPSFLDQVIVAATGSASERLNQALRDAKQKAEQRLRRISLAGDAETRALLLPYVRSLRTTGPGFADDGPATARALLTRLKAGAPELVEDIDFVPPLAQAAASPPDPPLTVLHELARLRDKLLDRLTGAARITDIPVADPSIVALFEELSLDLEERVAASPDGVASALLDYLDDLRGNPETVDRTLRAYTMSLASTCQQAVSRGVVKASAGGEGLFDTVIVDEAARANPLDLMIPMARARRRIILVGDHKQLPHMLDPEVERELTKVEERGRDRLAESLFKRLVDLWELGGEDGHRRFVRLDTQFRMHPVLGQFVSDVFYDKELRSARPAAEFTHGIKRYGEVPAAWISVPRGDGPETRRGTSLTRPAEASAIADELDRLLNEHPGLTFGVIAFYSAQVELIWEQLGRRNLAEKESGAWTPVARLRHGLDGVPLDRLRVGTVDAFQGMEFDVVYLSVVRSAQGGRPGTDRSTYGHLMSPNRLCVSMSRQRRLLVTVGDEAMFGPAAPVGVKPVTYFLQLCREAGVVLRP
jgi:hypothetical protein